MVPAQAAEAPVSLAEVTAMPMGPDASAGLMLMDSPRTAHSVASSAEVPAQAAEAPVEPAEVAAMPMGLDAPAAPLPAPPREPEDSAALSLERSYEDTVKALENKMA